MQTCTNISTTSKWSSSWHRHLGSCDGSRLRSLRTVTAKDLFCARDLGFIWRGVRSCKDATTTGRTISTGARRQRSEARLDQRSEHDFRQRRHKRSILNQPVGEANQKVITKVTNHKAQNPNHGRGRLCQLAGGEEEGSSGGRRWAFIPLPGARENTSTAATMARAAPAVPAPQTALLPAGLLPAPPIPTGADAWTCEFSGLGPKTCHPPARQELPKMPLTMFLSHQGPPHSRLRQVRHSFPQRPISRCTCFRVWQHPLDTHQKLAVSWANTLQPKEDRTRLADQCIIALLNCFIVDIFVNVAFSSFGLKHLEHDIHPVCGPTSDRGCPQNRSPPKPVNETRKAHLDRTSLRLAVGAADAAISHKLATR